MRRIQTESNAIALSMLVASVIMAVFYARNQLVYSTRIITKSIEIAFGS